MVTVPFSLPRERSNTKYGTSTRDTVADKNHYMTLKHVNLFLRVFTNHKTMMLIGSN